IMRETPCQGKKIPANFYLLEMAPVDCVRACQGMKLGLSPCWSCRRRLSAAKTDTTSACASAPAAEEDIGAVIADGHAATYPASILVTAPPFAGSKAVLPRTHITRARPSATEILKVR